MEVAVLDGHNASTIEHEDTLFVKKYEYKFDIW